MAIVGKLRLAIPAFVLLGLLAAADFIVAEDDKPAENQPADAKSVAKTPEQVFADLDKNGDGKLTADEVPADRQRLFERLLRVAGKDKGTDLTRAEFLAALKPDDLKVPAPQNLGGGGGRGNGFDPAQYFQRMDRNKDGKLTRDEVPEQAPPGIRQLFTRLNKTELTRGEEFVSASRERPSAAIRPPVSCEPRRILQAAQSERRGKSHRCKRTGRVSSTGRALARPARPRPG